MNISQFQYPAAAYATALDHRVLEQETIGNKKVTIAWRVGTTECKLVTSQLCSSGCLSITEQALADLWQVGLICNLQAVIQCVADCDAPIS
jgi:hypothetical protein